MAKAKKLIEADIQIDGFADQLKSWIRKAISAGKPVEVSAITTDDAEYDEKKSDSQREKFHAMIGDIKKTGVIHIPGRKIVMDHYDLEQCKALLVMWFVNEVKEEINIPNPPRNFPDPITGESISVRPSTKVWGKKLTSAFVEFLYATGTMANTKWTEPAMREYENYREANNV